MYASAKREATQLRNPFLGNWRMHSTIVDFGAARNLPYKVLRNAND